jgi:hypothetical protein
VPAAPAERSIVSSRAGYAIFRSEEDEADSVYVLFRCRAFISAHCHYDALSFVFFGLGRDWLVDSGYLNYHEWDRRRQYLRAPRAHSLVTIGDDDLRTGESECLEWGTSEGGNYAVGYHDLRRARHTRRVQMTRQSLTIVDQIRPARRHPARWAQLYQVAPDLEVEIISDREARLVADTAECAITQSFPGQWQLIRGQRKPRLQGWYSEAYGEWAPGITLVFRPVPGAGGLETRLELQAK